MAKNFHFADFIRDRRTQHKFKVKLVEEQLDELGVATRGGYFLSPLELLYERKAIEVYNDWLNWDKRRQYLEDLKKANIIKKQDGERLKEAVKKIETIMKYDTFIQLFINTISEMLNPSPAGKVRNRNPIKYNAVVLRKKLEKYLSGDMELIEEYQTEFSNKKTTYRDDSADGKQQTVPEEYKDVLNMAQVAARYMNNLSLEYSLVEFLRGMSRHVNANTLKTAMNLILQMSRPLQQLLNEQERTNITSVLKYALTLSDVTRLIWYLSKELRLFVSYTPQTDGIENVFKTHVSNMVKPNLQTGLEECNKRINPNPQPSANESLIQWFMTGTVVGSYQIKKETIAEINQFFDKVKNMSNEQLEDELKKDNYKTKHGIAFVLWLRTGKDNYRKTWQQSLKQETATGDNTG